MDPIHPFQSPSNNNIDNTNNNQQQQQVFMNNDNNTTRPMSFDPNSDTISNYSFMTTTTLNPLHSNQQQNNNTNPDIKNLKVYVFQKGLNQPPTQVRRIAINIKTCTFEDFLNLFQTKWNQAFPIEEFNFKYLDEENEWIDFSTEMEWKQALFILQNYGYINLLKIQIMPKKQRFNNEQHRFSPYGNLLNNGQPPHHFHPSHRFNHHHHYRGGRGGRMTNVHSYPHPLQFPFNDPSNVQPNNGTSFDNNNLRDILNNNNNGGEEDKTIELDVSAQLLQQIMKLVQNHKNLSPNTSTTSSSNNYLPQIDTETGPHFGIVCDGCNRRDWIGKRFRCKDCSQDNDGFDLCEECYLDENIKDKHFNGTHTFKQIFIPVPNPNNQNIDLNQSNTLQQLVQKLSTLRTSDISSSSNNNAFSDNNNEPSYETELKLLQEMGFVDIELNLILLKRFKGDIQKVVVELITRKEENQVNTYYI